MAAPAIAVEGVSKRYRLGRRLFQADTLRDQLAAWARTLRHGRQPMPEIWALRDVSFEVAPGEVLGVIGRNGAGKTTLFKVLSRVTEPTVGEARFRGRLASMLEVGTGFHTELTGRENVFLNGAILGMRRAEVVRRFDEIVEFAGVERFIDTPVKRYSSGMFVRLGFAVAAHLETDILLVDEVLAVGDAEFQRKSLGRMQDAARAGRTVLFVSHNMQAIRTLCSRAILLDQGRLVDDGPVDQVVRRYVDTGLDRLESIPETLQRVTGTGEAFVRRVQLVDQEGRRVEQLFFGQPFRVQVVCRVAEAVPDAAVEIGFSTRDGLRVATLTSLDRGGAPVSLEPGWWRFEADVDATFQPGVFAVDVAIHHWVESKVTIDWIEQAAVFQALDVPERDEDGYVHFATNYNLGAVRGFLRPSSSFDFPRRAEPLLPDSDS